MFRSFLVAVLMILISDFTPARAETWDGGGGDNLLSNGVNWVGNSAPKNNGTATLTFTGATRLKPQAGSNWSVAGIIFSGPASSFSLTGQQLSIGSSGIVSAVSGKQSILNPVFLAANQTWTAGSGPLVIDGPVTLNNKVATLEGPGEIQLNDNISSGFIDLTQNGTLTLSGLVSCDVDVQFGTLVIDTNQPQPVGSAINFSNFTKLKSKGSQSCDNSLFLSGQLTYQGSGNLQLTKSLQGTGSLVVDATGTLGLGAGYFSTFSGDLNVDNGTLQLTGVQPGVPMLGGSILVGDQVGLPGSSRLEVAAGGILAAGISPRVEDDGLFELTGDHDFGTIQLAGGEMTVDGTFTAGAILLTGNDHTARIAGTWALPSPPEEPWVDVQDGSAAVDLQFDVQRSGPGNLRFQGGGHVIFGGTPPASEGNLDIVGGTFVMDRPGGGSNLAGVEADQSQLFAINFNDQFGPSCGLSLLESSLQIASTNHELDFLHLWLGEVLAGVGGRLELNDDLIVDDDSSVEAHLVFNTTGAQVRVDAGATLTSDGFTALEVLLTGGGLWKSGRGSGQLVIAAGTLESTAGFSTIQVGDRLQVPLTGDRILETDYLGMDPGGTLSLTLKNDSEYSSVDATGALSLVGDADLDGTLQILLDPAASIGSGDEFSLVRSRVISGTFDSVQFPPSPMADHFWNLEYTPDGREVILRLEPTAGADLDLTGASNAQSHAFHEFLTGVAGMDFTVLGTADLQLHAVRIDSLRGPLFNDSAAGVRIYRASDQGLVASADFTIESGGAFRSVVVPVAATLQAGQKYRLAFYGAEGPLVVTRTVPEFPYQNSSLVRVDGAYLTGGQGDVFPSDPSDDIFLALLNLFEDGVSAVDPVPEPEVTRLALSSAPNPFNPLTKVAFDLPAPGSVRVDVMDVRGRRVTTLAEGWRESGRYSVDFNGRTGSGGALASGIYFIRLTTPGGTLIRKVTLVQ